MKTGAGLTISDVTSVIEAAKQVIADVIAEGGVVNTELFNAFPQHQRGVRLA
jgi:nucleoid DNA-binding protein